MEINQEFESNSESKNGTSNKNDLEKEKKKKRPTLTYYQPPGSRSSNKDKLVEIKSKNEDSKNSVEEKNYNKSNENDLNLDTHQNKKSYKSNRTTPQVQISKEQNVEQKDVKIINKCKSPQIEESKKLLEKNETTSKTTESVKLTQTAKCQRSSTLKVKLEEQGEEQKDKKIINISKSPQIEESKKETISKTTEPIQLNQNANCQRSGILKVKLEDINANNELTTDEEVNEIKNYKTLFDYNNPTKPIYVPQAQHKPKSNYINDQNNVNLQQHQYYSNGAQLLNNKNVINEAKIKTVIDLMFPLEQRLKSLVENCDYTHFKDSYEHINDLRKQLQRLCIQAIITHIEISTRLNIDLNYWKICYHQIIENLRKEYNYAANTLNDANYSHQLKQFCDFYINEGIEFYENFIIKIEEAYGFDKSLYLDLNKVKPVTVNKNIKLALLCVNRCLICLGDLARYKELFNEMKDYCLARSYYLKALYLAPKCSRAYNQLAILALYTRRRLDAVYYYMRCLELNQPLLTARQSLIGLFDESRKRSEIITENLNKKKLKSNSSNSNFNVDNSNRVELWIKSTTTVETNNESKTQLKTSSGDEDDCDDEIDNDNNELMNLSSVEFNKRFMHDYLNLIGKLFTKVGMDSYTEVCSRMLYEFRELLKRNPCPIGKMRLLQITIINISIVNLTKTTSSQEYYQQKNKQRGCAQRLFDAINKAKGFEANILRTFGNENVA